MTAHSIGSALTATLVGIVGLRVVVSGRQRRNTSMRSNKDLTDLEFVVSLSIKRALNALSNNNDVTEAKNHLYSALSNLHR